jgi:hypothetical protein
VPLIIKPWSQDDIERLKAMAASGASALRTSIALKRSLATTKRKAHELGIPFSSKCGAKEAASADFQGLNLSAESRLIEMG